MKESNSTHKCDRIAIDMNDLLNILQTTAQNDSLTEQTENNEKETLSQWFYNNRILHHILIKFVSQ